MTDTVAGHVCWVQVSAGVHFGCSDVQVRVFCEEASKDSWPPSLGASSHGDSLRVPLRALEIRNSGLKPNRNESIGGFYGSPHFTM